MKKILLLFMAFLFSCNVDRNFDNELVSDHFFLIDPQTDSDHKKHPLFEGESLDSCCFVQLETTSESLLGMVKKIEIDDSMIFVMDNNNKVSSFSLDGTFLANYGQIGSGPKEMRMPVSFYLNKEKKYVALFDYGGKKFFRYHYDGRLMDMIPVPENVCIEMVTHISMLDDKYLMVTYANSFLVKESSVLLNECDYSFERSLKPFVFHNKKENMSDGNNKITLGGLFITDFADYSDVVYAFRDGKIFSEYVLDSNKKAMIPDLVSTSNVDDEFSFRQYLRKNGYTLGISSIYATDDYLLLINPDISIYFNRLTKEVFKDRLDFSPFYHPVEIKTSSKEAFIGLIYPYQLIEAREGAILCPNLSVFKKDSRLEKILQEVEIEDNPIVAFYYPR